jgi:hypothetical protein
MSEPTNAERAARVAAALQQYTAAHYALPEERATVVQDFITDVLHWWSEYDDLDPERVARMLGAAEDMFTDEVVLAAGGCPECERGYGPHYRGPCEHGIGPKDTGC